MSKRLKAPDDKQITYYTQTNQKKKIINISVARSTIYRILYCTP